MLEIIKSLQKQEDKIQPLLIPMSFTHTDTKKIKLYQFSFNVVTYICYN